MTSQFSGPTEAPDREESHASASTATVAVAVTAVAGVDVTRTVDAVGRQTHRAESVSVIGQSDADAPEGLVFVDGIERMVGDLAPSVDHVWILHGDAEPRPDALAALVAEIERAEASLAGSKLLVAGTKDTLEGVGSATDIFGEPYSGLDEGEVDLEQYDVVRDVAFVSSVSMLVRRDILKGLQGMDQTLPPVAAGLDLSQRVRIAGGRIIVVPSSEVFHASRCGRGGGWREQAGRLRAMLKVYTPITLLWMIPYALFTGLTDSFGSLLMGRWRVGPRYLLTWLWNLSRLPSTVAARGALSKVREVRDEELFRYQVGGSVRLRQIGNELSNSALALFDDDRPLTRRATEAWNSAGTWGLVVAIFLVLIGVRTIFLGGLPLTGHAGSFGSSALHALGRFLGGWNPAGLGTGVPVHPSVLPASVAEALLGDSQRARSIMTLLAFVAGPVGMSRLAGALRVGGPGSYLAGVAGMFGLPAALLARPGHWSALIALGFLPWALHAVMGQIPPSRRRWWGRTARAFVFVGLVACFAPWMGLIPLAYAVGVRVVGRFSVQLPIALVATAAATVGAPFALTRLDRVVGGTQIPMEITLLGVGLGGAAALTGMASGAWRAGLIGGAGFLSGIIAGSYVGPDLQIALLGGAAVGLGIVISACLRARDSRDLMGWLAVTAGSLALVVSLAGLQGGAAGLGDDQWGGEAGFLTLESERYDRTLLIATDPGLLPGESRAGPGVWYRLLDSRGPTLDQLHLGPEWDGDVALRQTLDGILSGASLEPGAELAEFGIRWVVAVDEATAAVGPVFDAQVDLNPLPLVDGWLVFENGSARAVAQSESGVTWQPSGGAFEGRAVDERIRLAVQGGDFWEPDWQPDGWAGSVLGSDGAAAYRIDSAARVIGLAWMAAMVAALGVWLWGRRR